MSAMHHDTSSDLKVVASKLKNVLEVKQKLLTLCLLLDFQISNTSLKARKNHSGAL